MKKLSKINLSFLAFGYAFLYVPIFFVIINSFSASEIPGIWTHFSFKWFKAVFEDDDLLRAALTSLQIAAISATGSVVLGVLAAVSTTKKLSESKGSKLLNGLIIMPIVMPEIIVGFSLLMLFIFVESIFGFPKERGVMTVVIGHIMATMAYVHITVRTRLLSFDNSIEEAAQDLGAKPFTIFLKIKIPLIGKAILAGWLLAFTLSLDDLVIASFLTGPGSTTLPILIFSNVRIGMPPVINAFATIFIAIIAMCTFCVYLTSKKKFKTQIRS